MDRKYLLPILGFALPSLVLAAKPDQGNLFRYAFKPAGQLQKENDLKREEIGLKLSSDRDSKLKVSAGEPTSLPSSDNFNFLEGPDGSTWFYTYTPTIVEVPIPGGYEGLTEKNTTEYEFHIYDNNLKLVGSIRDKVVVDEAAFETRAAQVALSGVVTRKFFNTDDKYEVIVSTAMNRSLSANVYPQVSYHSYVYSIGGQKDSDGFDKKIQTLDGYLIDGINSAKDKWSENFYLTFLTETGDLDQPTQEDFLNSCKMNLTTYSKASYSGGINTYKEYSVGLNNLPGDQMSSPMMMSFLKDGSAHFAFCEYEKNFYLTQGTFDPTTGELSDPVQNEGNNLVITIFSEGYGEPKQIQQTKIPVVIDKNIKGALYTFYGLGNLRYTKDIDYGNLISDSSKAAFFINKQVYVAGKDDYVESYLAYDNNGEELLTIADACDSFLAMSDISGEDPQIMFVYYDGAEYTLKFVDLYTGQEDFTIGQTLNGDLVTSDIDRVPFGDSYRYGVSMAHAVEDAEGNTIHTISWMDNEGNFVGSEKLNLGPDVAYAKVYIDQEALDPYIFNTDNEREYMVLLKRYSNSQHTAMQEELSVVSPLGQTLLNVVPDPEMGNIANVTPLDFDSNPRLLVIYRNSNYKFTPMFYELPLVKFAGGDGTAENPFLIASAGDLKQIASNPKAHYALSADIDASNMVIPTVTQEFAGTLDGKGHTISNLTVGTTGSSAGLFARLSAGSAVSNLNIVNATQLLDPNADRAGIIAADASEATISDVHVYNLAISPDAEGFSGIYGGLVGQMSLRCKVEKSSVSNAVIDLPEANVGGIAGSIRTGSSITETSFHGSIKGATEVGGITGGTLTGDETISDCHVDAAIVAENTVGGIVGNSSRGPITRCYVEGSIEATTPNRWTDAGPCAGGVVGYLAPATEKMEGTMMQAPATEGVVTNCFVKLDYLKGYTSTAAPEYPQQQNTMHRIVGFSRANVQPDENVVTDPDTEIANNYAISTLSRTDGTVAAEGTTTEGADIAESDLDRDFFDKDLGFSFGDENPWNDLSDDSDPALNHEASAFFNPAVLTPEEGTTFSAALVIVTREPLNLETIAGDFSCTSSDEEVAMPTGNFSLQGSNTLLVEFRCEKVGTAEITAYVNGAQAKCTVNSKVSGINDVTSDSGSGLIRFDGKTVYADGCALALYSMSGTLVASGRDAISVGGVQPGIYVASAQNGDKRSVLKIVIR